MNKIKLEHKGDIVLGTEVMVSDPCYKIGTWCQGVIENVVPGTYHCNIEYYDDHYWGTRVSAIEVINESYNCNEIDYLEVKFEVGVDSGQAGIFDYAYYEEHHKRTNNGDNLDDKWYCVVCGLTYVNNKLTGNTIDGLGFVSSSGYGDGSYYCYVAYDIDDNVIAIRIEFIDEDEDADDYEYEEDYDDEDECYDD